MKNLFTKFGYATIFYFEMFIKNLDANRGKSSDGREKMHKNG